MTSLAVKQVSLFHANKILTFKIIQLGFSTQNGNLGGTLLNSPKRKTLSELSWGEWQSLLETVVVLKSDPLFCHHLVYKK